MTLLTHEIDEFPIRMSAPATGMASALTAFGSREPVVIGHGADCVMVLDAANASTAAVASLVHHGSGLIFVAMQRDRLYELEIPELAADRSTHCPRSYVAVDAADGIGTGISATDRAETIRRLGDPHSEARAFGRPGHVIPVAADLTVGAVPTAPQVALMFSMLLGTPTPAVGYAALVSVAHPCDIATPEEGASLAAELGLAYVDGSAIIRSYYES
jgi:3,4-dihydroxy 2-butanone 4-phosphate synthase / GTP cyclohydrolase II